MEKKDLKMDDPIWVWLYDFGATNYPEMWKNTTEAKAAHPQAHTYGFRSEAAALAHPARMGWDKDHKYVLQKVYLN